MPCTKEELVSAITSYAAARLTNDNNLIKFGGDSIVKLLDTLEFSEPAPVEKEEDFDDYQVD